MTSMKNLARWMVCGALLTAACVEQPRRAGSGSGPSAREVEAVRSRVASNTAPNPAHRLNINFDNKVTLLGYDITPDSTSVRPGARFTVKWYWKCEQAVGDGWKLFTHFTDATTSRENHDADGSDVRRLYQPERWRRGEYITDVQEFTVAEGWNQPILRIYTGLWKGDERMPVRSTGHQMSEGRALAIELQTGVTAPAAQPAANPAPTAQQPSNLSAPRAGVPPNIDGRLDDVAWSTAVSTGPLVNTMTGQPAGADDAHASVRVLWDDRFLYLGWEVQDDNLVETGTARDAHYWENDAVEVLIDPDGDGTNYYEIQVSPGGHTFDSQQPQPPSGGNFGRTEWNPNMRVVVTRRGTLGNPADQDTGYTVEMAIPWSDINAGAAHTPPQPGDTWRVNFFVLDKTKQGGQRAAGWSAPLAGSFHTIPRFGRITFVTAPTAQAGIVPIMGPAVAAGAQAQPTPQPAQPDPAEQPTPQPAQPSANTAQPQGPVALPRNPAQITPAMLNQIRQNALRQRNGQPAN
jgi:hypothetical protein